MTTTALTPGTTAAPPAAGPEPRADTTHQASSNDLPEVATAQFRQPWSRRGALLLLKAYQGAASGRVSTCRYYPSCSNYAVEAFSVHGFWRAFGLTARRLLRCRPFGPHGIDLVPLPDGVAPTATHDCEAAEHQASTAREVHQPC
jgi:putative membrane protein insertion efficiency factor